MTASTTKRRRFRLRYLDEYKEMTSVSLWADSSEDAMKRLIEICDPAPSIAYITEV